MKISLVVSNLSGNCFGRAYTLAKALQANYKIEIVGFTGPGGIWPPCDTGEFLAQSVPMANLPMFLKSGLRLVSRISGDVVYALKPLPTSFGLALIKKWRSGRPVVLDIDDWELGIRLSGRRVWLNTLLSMYKPESLIYTVLMERMVGLADGVTAVSDFLLKRFGSGVKVPHGRDVHWLDPACYDGAPVRMELGLQHVKVIVWLGTPVPHKGLEDLALAVRLLNRSDLKLLIVGAGRENPVIEALTAQIPDSLIALGVRPFEDLPRYLAAADLVVLPQRVTPASLGQVPAKIFDAMAMARPIIATAVSDIPQILDGCGVVIPPGNPAHLAMEIGALLDEPCRAARLGALARQKCVREYSIEAMGDTLSRVFDSLL